VTVTREIMVRPEDQGEFLALLERLNSIGRVQLRNGAFLYRVEESLEHPGTFQTEMMVRSWAEHLRR
jgi:hypothetical protein